MSYRLQFIDSVRFVASSFSNLVNNFTKGIHKIKCKFRYCNKIFKTCKTKYKNFDCFLEYIIFKDDLIESKCLFCCKYYQKKFDKGLKKGFFNTQEIL